MRTGAAAPAKVFGRAAKNHAFGELTTIFKMKN
jgi:hypothetical protein